MLRLPAEFEPHAATWLCWPHNEETWPGCLAEAEREFLALIEALAESEPLHVLTQDPEHRERVRRLVPGGVELHVVCSDDSWLRDTGPTFVCDDESGTLLALDWCFNAWGGKYPPWERDDAVASRIAGLAGVGALRPEIVLEGGALEVDGQGTLIATRSSLIDPKRNPALSADVLVAQLAELLGVSHLIWLEAEIAGDDTDAHVDNIARFVAPGRVVCAREDDPADPNHASLESCGRRLRESVDAHGRALDVIDLPMPPVVSGGDERLPASYANFYVANSVVVVPGFGAARDEEARERLASLFPERSAISIPSRTLVRGLGSLHCLTQQQPAPTPTHPELGDSP